MNTDFLHVSRRHLFKQTGFSLGTAALGSLLARESKAALQPHFAPKAKHVIYLHMIGAPSQPDLFAYQTLMTKLAGQRMSLIHSSRFTPIEGWTTPGLAGK